MATARKVELGTDGGPVLRTLGPLWLNASPFLGFAVLLNVGKSGHLRRFAWKNFVAQVLTFLACGNGPTAVTGIMSWVDLAWPTGLCLLALQTKLNSKGGWFGNWRATVGALLYMFQGGRMASVVVAVSAGTPCSAVLCYAMLCYAMLCCAVLRYAMLCYAVLCYDMLCCAMLCCAVLTPCYVGAMPMVCTRICSLLY